MKNLKILLTATIPAVVSAQINDTEKTALTRLDTFEVMSSQDQAFSMPGSGTYIGPELLEQFQYTSINETLRQSPGVYVRDDDGYGLFPNISIRGVDTNRSAKLTLMEDGVLTAPAPYSAPAAYYSPTAGRMHACR